MHVEKSYKFREILNRIIFCVSDYIDKNINNPSLVESKLLSINNYIIDILHSTESSIQNSFISNFHQTNSNSYIHSDKRMMNQLISSAEHKEKNKTMTKFKRKYLNNNNKEKNENIIHSYNAYNKNPNNKKQSSQNKNRIIKLIHKTKNAKDKNNTKEFSFLKQLSYIQKKLNIYELKNKEKLKQVEKNHNSLNYFTINNSYNKYLNNFSINIYPNNSKIIKHSMSQYKLRDISNNNDINTYEKMKIKYELRKKKIMKLNNFVKFDFEEIKNSIEKKMDKIKKINLKLPLSNKKI